jgi:hypothetical protein
MEISFSSVSEQQKIYSKVTLTEKVEAHGGVVEVACWIENSDSRAQSAQSTKLEAVRLLKLALSTLEPKCPQ